MNDQQFDSLRNDTSKTFCMAKFHEATIWLYSGKIASCHHNPFHAVGDTVDTFYNTTTKRSQQKLMLSGEKPDACNYCWKLESQGLESDRFVKSKNYAEHLDANEYLNSSSNFKPKVLELAFQKTCNLACSYCNADFSTQWLNDIKTNGVYTNIVTDKRLHYQRPASDYVDNNVDTELFWTWLDEVVDGISVIRITGGEPLLHEETFRLFDYVRSKNPNVEIAINSNLCQKATVLERFKDKVQGLGNVTLYTSNESSNETAEFLRDGLIYSEWLTNLADVSAYTKSTYIMTTIGAISLQSLDTFILDIVKLREQTGNKITIGFNFLTFPEFQSFDCLSEGELLFYFNKYSKFFNKHKLSLNEFEQEQFLRVLTLLQKPQHVNHLDLRIDAESFFEQYTLRRAKPNNLISKIGKI